MTVHEITITTPAIPPRHLPTVLTVAGSDSSGGAGIEADLKTITAHGCYGLTCITALTMQNTQGVNGVTFTDRDTLQGILSANFEDLSVDVVKTGLLTLESIEVLSLTLEKYHVGKPLVVDPVMVATTGAQLSGDHVLKIAVDKLFKRATLITPNIPETVAILKLYGIELDIYSTESMIKAAELVHQKTGAINVLVKGGHLLPKADDKKELKDVLYCSTTNSITVFKSEFVDTVNTHGTGCTLASAIASNLASGIPLVASVESAIRYVHCGIVSAEKIGRGNGPLNHIYHIAPPSFGLSLATETPFTEGHFVDFLTTHPLINPIWNQYIHHPFVAELAKGTLPKEKFVHFVSQDYPYLVNYARVHSIAASVAPDIHCLEGEIVILNTIKHELGEHTKRLVNHGVTDVDSLLLNESCQTYIDYLMEIARGGDWLEINVALAPCLFGYYYAAASVKASDGIPSEYKEWLETYTSDSYKEAVDEGAKTLEKHSVGISLEKTLKLVKIYADVCQLESNFWEAALAF